MADPFETAAREVEREVLLLGRRFDVFPLPELPIQALETPSDDTAAPLGSARLNRSPTVLPPGTRARFLKQFVLRLLRVFTYGQELFNAAILAVVESLEGRLRLLLHQMRILASRLDERSAERVAQLEERRGLWESRLAGDMESLAERIFLLEAELAGYHDREKEGRDILASVKDALSQLQPVVARQETLGSLHEKRLDASFETGARLQEALATAQQRFETLALAQERRLETSSESVARLHEALAAAQRTSGFAMDRQRAVFGDQSYLEFEEQNRGTRADILGRQKPYIAILSKVAEAVGEGAPFVDLGCGRGELLELASEAGLKMRGVDHDPGMVAYCRARGLEATQRDIFKCLEETTDGSLAGITAIQVIEHLPYHRIVRLVGLAYQKLRAGGCLILETINPFSVYAMRHFYTDPSHIQPVPPTTAAFLIKARGFVDIRTLQLSPVENDPAQAVLKKDSRLAPLEDFLFGYQDYAVVATKP